MRAGDVVVSLKYKNISLLTYPFRLALCDREGENLILYLFILHHATKTCISWSGAIAEWELGLTARKIRPATTMIRRAAIWKVRV